MNKLTLSAAALTAIVAPAQMQAADLSPDDKASEIKRVRKDLTDAINEIGKMDMAVRKIHLVTLSGISAEIDTYAGTDKVLTEETVDGWDELIKSTKETAKSDQMPYDSKTRLDNAIAEFQKKYTGAVETVKGYAYAGAAAKRTLDGYKAAVDGIKTTVDGFDLTKRDIITQELILMPQITEQTNAIDDLLAGIQAEDDAIANTKDAADTQAKFKAAYDDAKAVYMIQRKAVAETLKVYPYQDWIEEVNAKLNGQSRLLDELKAADDAQFKAVKADPTDENKTKYATDSYERKVKAENARDIIGSVLGSYEEGVKKQDEAKEKADKAIADLEGKLTNIKTELDNRKITDCNEAITNVKTLIANKKNEVTDKYEEHEIYGYNLYLNVIETPLNKIIETGNGLIANYEANKRMIDAIGAANRALTVAVDAAKAASKDKYAVTENFAVAQEKIEGDIKNLETAVTEAYNDKKAADYEESFNIDPINDDIKAYINNTTAALAAYDKAQAYIAKARHDRDVLVVTAKDKTVIVAGTTQTYANKIATINNDITNIENAVADALKITDNAGNHLKAIKEASEKTVSEDILGLIDAYSDNKDFHDNQLTINAAQNVLDAANGKIVDIQKVIDSIDGDFGFQKDDIENKKTALNGKLDVCKGTLNNEDVVAFTKEDATFEEKAAVVQKVIAALSTVVNDLEGKDGEGGIKKDVNDLKADADAAVANTTAYKYVVETLIPTQINVAINAFKDKIASVYPEEEAGDEAKLFFEGELARLNKAVEDAASGMETAYRDKKAVAKKDEIEPILEDYKKEANTLKDKIYLNKTQHNSQVTAADALMALYNQKYDYILNNDKSDAAARYLQNLNEQKTFIETLQNKTIPEAYKKGNSNTNPDKKNIEDEIERIKTEINDIANASKADYDKNVNTANQLQRDNFEKAYKAANEAFNNAVTTLNDFSNIQNDAIKTALASLIETHDKIYAYADSLRNLKAQEAGDWDKYWEKYKTEESLEYGADIYNAQAAVDTAVKYMNDIRKLKLDYQDNVNKKALELYQSKVDNAQRMIDRRKNQITDFIYDGKKNAFLEADQILAAVKEACALDLDGTVHDKDFAVSIDRNDWLTKLDDIYGNGNGLSDELLAACMAEKEKRVGDVTALYTSEYNMIASHDELKDYNGRNLIAELENLKVTTIDEAVDAIVNLRNVINTIIPKCAGYAQYTLTDGKYVLGHSSIYDEAVAALGDIQANDEAYGRMVEGIGLLESDFNDVKEIVEKLIVGHQDGDTYDALTSIEDDFENAKSGLENTKKNRGCVNYEKYRFDGFVNGIEGQLESLKTTTVNEEIEQLNEKLKEVKEEYNQAAKENLDQVKEYDAQIDDLYNALKDIQDKFGKMDPNTAFEGAVDALAEQEITIAKINKELNDLYDNNKQNADAVKTIGDKLKEVNDAIVVVEGLVEYNEGEHDNVIQDTYLEQAQALRGEYGFINEDYENKNAAGQILFFQKNILHDLDVLLADTQKFGVGLKAMHDKHMENNDVYSTLNAELVAAKEALALAYGRIDALENKQPATNPDFKTLIEEKNAKFESDFENLQDELNEMHEGVNLTKTESINRDINGFNGPSGKIYELERDAKNYDAKERLVSLEDDIWESLNNIDVQKNEGRKYDIGREAALRDEYNAIQALCGYAKSYNNDAFDNYVFRDINNNPVYHWENGIRYDGDEIDYNTTAWDTIDERISTLTEKAKQFAADVEGSSFRQGDVDQNNKVNVNDYSEVRNIILNAQSYEDVKAEAEGRALAADCNEDKDINVADLTGVSNILLHGKWDWSPASNGAKKTRAKVSAEDEINISNEGEETTIFGKTVRMAVNLAHSEAFTSGQMDITMPQGMKIVGQSMSDRANGHDIFANDLGNGVTRLLTATIDNNEFNGRNGALIYLDVEVSSDFSGGQISIDNIIFSDAAGRMYTMSSIGGNGDGATGIDGIKAATVKERIYSVGGQMMKAVKKGINIIVGEDGKARKIVNK